MRHRLAFALLASGLLRPAAAAQPAPTIDAALQLKPMQADVEYDKPTADEAKKCKLTPEKIGKGVAWVVRAPDGAVLRQFNDSDNDGFVDLWSYYRGGLEVYRDAELTPKAKGRQCRWFHTGGSRWGIDKDGDGEIDSWKFISAEEASEEVVAALKSKNAKRFERLLLSKDDVAKLGLAKDMAKSLTDRLAEAPKTFAKLVAENKLGPDAQYSDFGGVRPGAVPAGVRGSTKDLLAYENVWAMALAGGQPVQLQMGSMVYLDGCWKLIDGPSVGADAIAKGFFFNGQGAPPEAPQIAAGPTSEPNDEMQKIFEAMQKLDDELAQAAPDKKAALAAQRADLLEKLAAATKDPAEREQGIIRLADQLSANVQDGGDAASIERLKKLEATLVAEKASDDLLAHVEFVRLRANWGLTQAQHKPEEYSEIHPQWIKELEDFVAKHKSGEDVAEALLQLGMESEFGGKADEAQKWYDRLAKDFSKSPQAAKAQGAVRRLTAEGKPMQLKGPDVGGAAVDLGQYKGKVVLIHYWSASLSSIKDDHEKIADLYKKYGGPKFDVIGVNLDYSKDEVVAYLKENPNLRWKNLYEPGAFDSRLANEMGVITVPMLVLVDDKGAVVSTSLQVPEVEGELAKLLAARVANAKN